MNCTLADIIKKSGLNPGMVIHFYENVPPIIVGDCTPYIRPTNNDGEIGWDFNEDYCTLKISKIDYFPIRRNNEPSDFRKLFAK